MAKKTPENIPEKDLEPQELDTNKKEDDFLPEYKDYNEYDSEEEKPEKKHDLIPEYKDYGDFELKEGKSSDKQEEIVGKKEKAEKKKKEKTEKEKNEFREQKQEKEEDQKKDQEGDQEEEINSFEDLFDKFKIPRDDLSENIFKEKNDSRFELDASLRKDVRSELINQIHDARLKAERWWYQKNKEILSKKGVYLEGADSALVTKIFNEQRGIKEVLKNQDLMKEFERYGKLNNEAQKTEPSIIGYMKLINEIKRIVAEQNSIPESEKSLSSKIRQKDLVNMGTKLIENLTSRNLKQEGEKVFPSKTLKDSISEDAIKEKLDFIMNEHGNPEQLSKVLIDNYGWKREIVRGGLKRGKIIYKNEKEEIVKEIIPNFFGSYDQKAVEKEVAKMLDDRIKQELESGYAEQEKSREKQVDMYVLSEFLKFDSTLIKESIVDEAIKSASKSSKKPDIDNQEKTMTLDQILDSQELESLFEDK